MRTNGKVKSKCSEKCQWLNVSRQAARTSPQTGQMPLTSFQTLRGKGEDKERADKGEMRRLEGRGASCLLGSGAPATVSLGSMVASVKEITLLALL